MIREQRLAAQALRDTLYTLYCVFIHDYRRLAQLIKLEWFFEKQPGRPPRVE